MILPSVKSAHIVGITRLTTIICFGFAWVFSRDFALNVEGNAKGCRLAQKGFSTPWLVILDFDFDEHDFHDLVKKQCEITKNT